MMQRREFIKSGLTAAGSLIVSSPFNTYCADSQRKEKSKIIIARDPLLQPKQNVIDSDRLVTLLDSGMQAYFDKDNALEAWKMIVRPGEVIGLKVNCLSGPGGTHRELVEAICERLLAVGINADNIIIWDRLNEDLEDGGFRIVFSGNQIKCFGNDVAGFSSDFEIFGSAASLVSKTITQICDGVINLPVLKDHGIAGLTMSLKNMFGAIHNPNKYHLNLGDPYIADVNMLPSIRGKIRFTICDALNAQYEGGPSHMPHWTWPYNGLLIGTDPVALDYQGWQIIETERLKRKIKSLKEAGREPTYISTAADAKHRLGTNDPKLMDIVMV
jgi:uncharacterized protein (DUF362 family)